MYEHKVIVLMYHRIADLQTDPWELAVKQENFEQHLHILKKEYKVISVSQLVAQLQKKAISANSICITFDDVYLDNYSFAKPLLEKYNLPATFFVPTNYVDQKKAFWWDELERLFLNAHNLPAVLSIQIGQERCIYQIQNQQLSAEQLQKRYNWRWPDTPPDQRCELYLDIWKKLKYLPDQVIQSVIKCIKEWAMLPEVDYTVQLPIDIPQLQEIIVHDLFEVGIHTATHPALSHYCYESQLEEIDSSKNYLQSKSSKSINTMAYPYGDYNKVTINAVKEKNLLAAFTTQEKLVLNNSDMYQLGRFQIRNWDGQTFKNNLSYWFKNVKETS